MPNSAALFQRSIDNATDCDLCAVVSRQNGELPIGSADAVNEWLFVQVPRPWKAEPWQQHGDYQALLTVVESLASDPDRYNKTRLQAIVPDRRTQPHSGLIRVMYYQRPATAFSRYAMWEYLLPLEQAAALVEMLLFAPDRRADFAAYAQPTEGIRDLFVCTHADYDVACGRFGAPIYQQLCQQYASPNLRVWQVNHFGGHQFAPTLLDFPTGRWWGHLLPATIGQLIDCEQLEGNVLANYLQQQYRGWSGADRWAQFLEADRWSQIGADWWQREKSTRVIRCDDRHFWQSWLRPVLERLPIRIVRQLLKQWNRHALGATVELTDRDSQGVSHTDRAIIRQSGTVKSQKRSGKVAPIVVPQYKIVDRRR